MKNRRVLVVLFLIAGIACAATAAHAQQRPLVTEDPETIGNGRVLLEAGFSLDSGQTNEANGVKADVARIGTFGASIGISPTAEIQIDGGVVQRVTVDEIIPISPLANTTSLKAGDTASSMDDLVIATKIRLLPETETRPALGVRLGTKLPTADVDAGVGLGTTDFFATFLMAKTVRSVRTVGNVGLVVLGNPVDGQDSATALGFGVSVARALTDAFEMVGEINGRLTPFDEVVPAGLNGRGVFRLAGRYTYAMLRLDFGVLVGMTNRDPNFGISAGATYVISR